MGQPSRSDGDATMVRVMMDERQSEERPASRRQGDLRPMGRWVEVLNAFLAREEWGVRDLAEATGLPRSAVHRILHEMQRHDLLSAAGAGRFRVGPMLIR